ncbi:hypothetical protein [Moritella sp. 28]|uniref:hypothetical protein n=1 Tax=Moritella sp. 28 TaxID=2746232 RepID=UPI001BA8B40A|nr:hypothetical protein [Moritella sp. 28]QUM84424.1 hypothetical protein HWV02_07855 [Moritella sp. 28]
MLAMKCKLCLENEDIKKSHIIPNAFFKYMKNNKGRYREVSKEGNKDNQVSYDEYLLCGSCELKFSTEFESYVIDFILRNPGSVGVCSESDSTNITLSNVDFTKLKLFQMSILWRAAVSTLDFYKHVKLAPNIIELLRVNLDTLTPVEANVLPCFMDRIFIDAPNDKTTLADRTESKMFISNPNKIVIDVLGFEYIYFIFGGVEWRFWMHSCSEYFIENNIVISNRGILNMTIKSIGTHNTLLEAGVLARINHLNN